MATVQCICRSDLLTNMFLILKLVCTFRKCLVFHGNKIKQESKDKTCKIAHQISIYR